MERAENSEAASVESCLDNGDDSLSAAIDAKSSPSPRTHDPEEKAKRTKHTRVQKREKELYGLVTPVFLPLLDARDTSPRQEKIIAQAHVTPGVGEAARAGDAESNKVAHQERSEILDMDTAVGAEPVRETYHVDPPKKTKRTAIKKSSLRAHNTSRSRRKRVSLVIDGQTVLPADTVVEPALTSPSETTSASNSTTSLDDMIDPRLTRHDPPSHAHVEHHEAVHHSLPLPMSSIHSPTKPLIETPTDLATSPESLRSPSTPSLPYAYNPTSAALHTFLNNPSSIPQSAGPEPIYADDLEVAEEDEDQFHTYVGGLHGSGADDVDQAGSYGYPSSLGASYLESYMQSRPLKVRMEAADRAELNEHEKKAMMSGGANGKEKSARYEEDEEFGMDMQFVREQNHGFHQHRHDDDEMDIVGSMEGF